MADLLVTRDIRKSFGGLQALAGVSLGVQEREITMLIGPNGSGKTTFINVVAGFYAPDAGQVFFHGIETTGWPAHRTYAVGLVRTFQIPQPFVNLTVFENLLTAARGNPGEAFTRAPLKPLWTGPESEIVDRAWSIVRLIRLEQVRHQPAHTLSGGQMKLLEIGRALMSGARMILMDEPIAGINPALAHEVFANILELRDKLGVSFFLVEHRLEIALQYVDRVLAMNAGQIVADGKPQEVIASPRVIESYLGA
jgi:branched-chain amino acid transport system ATP-binding protein